MSNEPPSATPWLTIAVLYCAGLGAAMQYSKFSIPFDALAAAYPDAGTGLGFAVSLISLLGIFLGFTAGLLVAQLGFRRMLIWGMGLGALVSLAQVALPPLGVLYGLRVLEGLSHLVIVVAAPTMMAQISAPRHQALVMTVWSTFFGTAFAMTAWGGMPLVAAQGLPALLGLHTIWMAAVAGALALVLPRITSTGTPVVWPRLREVLADHGQAYASPHQAAPALGWLFYTTIYVAILTVAPGQMLPEVRGWAVPLMPLAGLLVSLTVGVALTRVLPAVQVVILGFVLAGVLSFVLVAAPQSGVLAIVLLATLGLVQSGSFSAIPQLNTTPQARARANGALAQMGNLGNTFGTPVLLSLVALGGAGAMYAGVGAVCLMGLGQHLWQAARRRSA